MFPDDVIKSEYNQNLVKLLSVFRPNHKKNGRVLVEMKYTVPGNEFISRVVQNQLSTSGIYFVKNGE